MFEVLGWDILGIGFINYLDEFFLIVVTFKFDVIYKIGIVLGEVRVYYMLRYTTTPATLISNFIFLLNLGSL